MTLHFFLCYKTDGSKLLNITVILLVNIAVGVGTLSTNNMLLSCSHPWAS